MHPELFALILDPRSSIGQDGIINPESITAANNDSHGSTFMGEHMVAIPFGLAILSSLKAQSCVPDNSPDFEFRPSSGVCGLLQFGPWELTFRKTDPNDISPQIFSTRCNKDQINQHRNNIIIWWVSKTYLLNHREQF